MIVAGQGTVGRSGPPFTLRQLQIFVAVADAGSISGAASMLFVSQTAVSLAVGQLEKALGVSLLVRRRALGVQVTATGESVLRSARTMLAQAGDLHEEFSGSGALRGSVSVGCFPSLGPSFLPILMHGFLAAYPNASVSFRDGPADEMEEKTLSGVLDLMITYDVSLSADFHKVVLKTHKPGVLVSADHWAAQQEEPISVLDLAKEPFIALDTPLSAEHSAMMFQAAGIAPWIRYRSQNFETVRSLVGRGFGWTMLLQRPLTDVTHEGTTVVQVELVYPVVDPVPVVLAWSKAFPMSRTAAAFAEYVTRQYDV